MRCFIAVEVPKEIKDYLFELQGKLSSGRFAKINWVHKKNLHITLKFLGEIDEGKAEDVKTALKGVRFSKFRLRLNELGFFPDASKPKVVWIGLDPQIPLMELQLDVDGAIREYFPSEGSFKAHLTLGRVRFIKKKSEFRSLADKTKIERLPFEVESFKLVKSVLSKEGPKYETIEEFRAAGNE